MNTPDILAALSPLVASFNTIGIDYHIGGSVASSAYGIARATLDIDVVADINLYHVPSLVGSLEPLYYIEESAVRASIEHRSSFNVIHLDTLLKIDVFILKNTPYDRLAFSRKRPDRIVEDNEASIFNFSSSEDVILHKLTWFRLGNEVSERQWFDVIGVLKVQNETVDREYLHRWARELGVSDLLERALTDAGIFEKNQ
jgi:hypothetical protein